MAEQHVSDNIVAHGYHAGSVRPTEPTFADKARTLVRRAGYGALATGIGALVYSMANTIYEVGAGTRSSDAMIGVYALAVSAVIAGGVAVAASREN